MINSKVRLEVSDLVSNIEALAVNFRTALANGNDVIQTANELVAKTMTLTFSVGELYALENVAASSAVATVKVNSHPNWQRPRDNNGRFIRATVTKP